MKEHWAIIGGGNGGQAFAAYLSMEGLDITLYDIFPQTVDAINKQGGIHLDGSAKNSGKILFASTDMEKVISNASVILVVLPSIYHNSIAQKIAPLLKDGQIVILNPITPLGTIDFQNTLTQSGCTADIVLAGTHTLLFACRAVQPKVGVRRPHPAAAPLPRRTARTRARKRAEKGHSHLGISQQKKQRRSCCDSALPPRIQDGS